MQVNFFVILKEAGCCNKNKKEVTTLLFISADSLFIININNKKERLEEGAFYRKKIGENIISSLLNNYNYLYYEMFKNIEKI